jgi:hypothetical protein
MTDEELFAKLKELTDNGKSFFVEKQNSNAKSIFKFLSTKGNS